MKNPLNRRLLSGNKGRIRQHSDSDSPDCHHRTCLRLSVADGSMLTAYNESFEKYNIEDGHFTTVKQMNKGPGERILKRWG